MRESRTYGSVRGALSNERPYRNPELPELRNHCVAAIADMDLSIVPAAIPPKPIA
jgi:hypothetical protein